MKKQTTALGQEHGLLETIANSVLDTGYKNLSEKNRKEMIERRKKDLELTEVRYQNLKNQDNGKWEGWYAEYPGEPMYNFRMLHDNKYLIPRGLARKINAMKVPQQSGIVSVDGSHYQSQNKFDQTHQVVSAGEF